MKLGIALGGGGAKGYSHIGVLKTFQEAGIEFDVIAGTSIGALVGAVYASGNLEKAEASARNVKLKDIPLLLSPALSKQGFFSGKNAIELLSDYVCADLIEDLPKKFAAVSVDLNTSSVVTFTKGDIRRAVRASISLPAVFTPVQTGEHLLVDGGILEPLPVRVARELGADYIVAVDLFGNDAVGPNREKKKLVNDGPLTPHLDNALGYLRSVSEKLSLPEWLSLGGESEEKNRLNMIDIVERTISTTQREITALHLKAHPPDLLIQPAVADVGLLDFHRAAVIIARGIKAAEGAVSEVPSRG